MTATFHDLAGASVFVTGGGSGIGAALTEAFLRQKARVCFVDHLESAGFVSRMTELTGNAPLFIPCDVTDTEALHAAMDRAATEHGPFKAVVNNAANDTRMAADAVTPAQWDTALDVNLKHYFFACQRAARHMPDGGAIINFSSTSYMIGSPSLSPYVAANAGIMGMTRALAREWGGRGIRVNAVAPGWVLTDRQLEKWATPEALAAFLDRQCLKQHMKPADLAGTVLFLASDLSAMITSQMLVVDAGLVSIG